MGVPGDTPFFPTSAVKGSGRREMLGWVEDLLAGHDGQGQFDWIAGPEV